MKNLFFPLLVAVIPAVLPAEVPFKVHAIVEDGADKWWARSHADVNGDGLLDFFVVNDNGGGGWLAWFETRPGFGPSVVHLIAERGPEGGTFAAGDLDSGDIDGDGDIDVIGPVSPGEWGGSSEPSTVYWYENPGWQPHRIGAFPSLVKDFDLVDLNGDGKLDLAGTTFDAHKMVVFRQDAPDTWKLATEVYVDTLHEGQHVGDVDDDGDVDVISTAFWLVNPGGAMTDAWQVRNIDPYWNTDDGDSWEYNATKIACADIDGDGRDEVFISCSERFRNRVAWFDLDPDSLEWTRHEIGLNSYAHTLQVGDVDLDGDLDVISGNNGDQGWPEFSPVILFTNSHPERYWGRQLLTMSGAYNSYLADADGDGDLDFFRYDGHVGENYELWENLTR